MRQCFLFILFDAFFLQYEINFISLHKNITTIMTTTALNALWTYLQSLSLTPQNREWLANKLVTPYKESEEEIEARLTKKYQEIFGPEGQKAADDSFAQAYKEHSLLKDSVTEEEMLKILDAI